MLSLVVCIFDQRIWIFKIKWFSFFFLNFWQLLSNLYLSIDNCWIVPRYTNTIINSWNLFISISILSWNLSLRFYIFIIISLKVLFWIFGLILNKILQRTKLLLAFTLYNKIFIWFIINKWLNFFLGIHIGIILSPTRLSSDKHFFAYPFSVNINVMYIRKSTFMITAWIFSLYFWFQFRINNNQSIWHRRFIIVIQTSLTFVSIHPLDHQIYLIILRIWLINSNLRIWTILLWIVNCRVNYLILSSRNFIIFFNTCIKLIFKFVSYFI